MGEAQSKYSIGLDKSQVEAEHRLERIHDHTEVYIVPQKSFDTFALSKVSETARKRQEISFDEDGS